MIKLLSTNYKRRLVLATNKNCFNVYKLSVREEFKLFNIWNMRRESQIELFDSKTQAEGRYLQRSSKGGWECYEENIVKETSTFFNI